MLLPSAGSSRKKRLKRSCLLCYLTGLGHWEKSKGNKPKWLGFLSHIEGFFSSVHKGQMNSLQTMEQVSLLHILLVMKEWYYLSLIKWNSKADMNTGKIVSWNTLSILYNKWRFHIYEITTQSHRAVFLCSKSGCFVIIKLANKKLSLQKHFLDTFSAFWKQNWNRRLLPWIIS